MSSLAIRRGSSPPLAPAWPQPPQCPPSRAASKGSLRLFLPPALARCSRPRPALSSHAFRARFTWARLFIHPRSARPAPEICPLAHVSPGNGSSGAIASCPPQRYILINIPHPSLIAVSNVSTCIRAFRHRSAILLARVASRPPPWTILRPRGPPATFGDTRFCTGVPRMWLCVMM